MQKGKNKIQIDYSSDDIYNFYCLKTGNPHKLTQKQFSTITKDFFKTVIHKMIYEGFEMTMPKRLGNLRITKTKNKPRLLANGDLDTRILRVNYMATKTMWKRIYPELSLEEIYKIQHKPVVYHDNKHTNGWTHKWHWDKRTCLVRNAKYYKIDIARSNDRELAKALKDESLNLDFYTHK